ncbi:MAG: hypothetical protein ABJH72_04535, partial [Reichenbachiella sp.]
MKVIKHFILPSILILCVMLGCEPMTEELSTDTSIQLSYSTDTVTFDTLFSSVGSITKRFKVYNRNSKAINVSRMYLGNDDQSPYTMVVNGKEGKGFENEVIFGKDSLLVLVEVLIDT